ncbi:acyl-CoA reductase-like NAD-dependent aldehyde dehydrogenase [Arthrobacter sp. UYCu512]
MGPAELACGGLRGPATIVFKPAGLTPPTAQLFAQTMLDAGLPAGVLNVVASASAAGSSGPLLAGGQRLMADTATNVLSICMELGRNAPFIVFEDAPGQGRRRRLCRQDAEHGVGM